MSSYFQESSSSLAPSVAAASSAFNWQALHNHHHQLQQQQMNLQPNHDIFHSHYTNLYHSQGYPNHHSLHHQKYNDSNYAIPSSGGTTTSHIDQINFSNPTSSSLPLLLNNTEGTTALEHEQQQYSNSTSNNEINNSLNNRRHDNNIPDNSITNSSRASTNNNVTNNSLDTNNPKRASYSSTPLESATHSLRPLSYSKTPNTTASSIPSSVISTALGTSSVVDKIDTPNIHAAQTAAAAAAAVAAYTTPTTVPASSLETSNVSDGYSPRMNLGFPYGSVQGMTGAGMTSASIGDPNAAAMAAVHAAAASHGCYDMYTAASMASKNSSFYPWMKNYPGNLLIE